jgi:hypothetical protein
MLEEMRALVASWRTYRRMLADGMEPHTQYARLVTDFAFVIRRRLGR